MAGRLGWVGIGRSKTGKEKDGKEKEGESEVGSEESTPGRGFDVQGRRRKDLPHQIRASGLSIILCIMV